MTRPSNLKASLDHSKALDILRNKIPGLEAVYVFGSQVTDYTGPDSDIDIAFLTYEDINNVERWKIQEDIAVEYRVDIDLIDLFKANTVLQNQVLETGKLIFARDQNKVEAFEAKVYFLYLDLLELRKPIIDNIRESGSIYG